MAVPDHEIRIDTGRCEGGTFVRVVHIPTGQAREQRLFGNESTESAALRLRAELEAAVEAGDSRRR